MPLKELASVAAEQLAQVYEEMQLMFQLAYLVVMAKT